MTTIVWMSLVMIFRDGRKRKCSCSDGSVADLTQRVCPQGLLTLLLELIFINNIRFGIHISKERIKEPKTHVFAWFHQTICMHWNLILVV